MQLSAYDQIESVYPDYCVTFEKNTGLHTKTLIWAYFSRKSFMLYLVV